MMPTNYSNEIRNDKDHQDDGGYNVSVSIREKEVLVAETIEEFPKSKFWTCFIFVLSPEYTNPFIRENKGVHRRQNEDLGEKCTGNNFFHFFDEPLFFN